jgi:Domain of unknown function (DUF4398)
MARIPFRNRRFLQTAGVLGVLLVALMTVSGCATRSKISASNEIATAQFAIRDARASGAETHASESLQKADAYLSQAQKLSGQEAERMAQKAVAYAQLASTVAQRETARKQLRDALHMEQEAEALRVRTTNAVEERLQ